MHPPRTPIDTPTHTPTHTSTEPPVDPADSPDPTDSPAGTTRSGDPRLAEQQWEESDDRTRALLLHIAEHLTRRPGRPTSDPSEAGEPRLVSCLTAAADELLDPLQLPRPYRPADLGLAEPLTAGGIYTAIARARQHLLDHRRPGGVRQILQRGRAARELAEALHLIELANPAPDPPAAPAEPPQASASAPAAGTVSARPSALPCSCQGQR